MFHRRCQILIALVAVFCWLLAECSIPAAAPQALTFETDIRPILKTSCFSCHGEGEKLRGGVDLRLRRFMVNKQVDNGVVIVPGDPTRSLLLALVRSGQMPKADKKLTADQVALVEKWIAQGAPTAREEPPELPRGFQITEEERRFWAFQPIKRPHVPAIKSARVRTPVDAFVLSQLRARGLDFAPEADRTTLIRRVYLDLTGLPPTPEAVAQFVADASPDAYERLVDRVLDSAHYGEHWARHWLDVVGYADSNGYAEADSPRPHAWHYRDYVIRALNGDIPWDQFIQEQLAGDELAQVTQEQAVSLVQAARVQDLLTATGFLRMAPDGTGDEVTDVNLARNQVMAETIKIVSSSFLGLTIGCAQCHDHRYDPVSQKDYYRFRAIFEPALNWKHWRTPSERLVSLYTAADRAKADKIEAAAHTIDEAANQLRKTLLEKVFERELAKLPDEIQDAVKTARNTAREKRSPAQVALLKEHPSADVQYALNLYDPAAEKQVQAKLDEATRLRATKPIEPFLMALTEPSGSVPETFVFDRGDHDQPKAQVTPAELEIIRLAARENRAVITPASFPTNAMAGDRRLADIPSSLSLGPCASTNTTLLTSGRRLAYARWLTSGSHPLVARVLVNRFWLQHFGRGLVASAGDFGQLGERPSHPELLDWLASEFMAGGWKLKAFHRLLLTSTVYRQSVMNEAAQRIDPDNRLYGRMRPKRLEAETLRDSILAVSGSLNLEQFGPAVPIARDGAGRVVVGRQKMDGRGDPTIVEGIDDQAYRRSVYVEVRRSLPLSVLEAFDEPVMSPNCEARIASTVSPQALMMLNDTFVLDQSRRFAERLGCEFPGNLRAQVDRAWRLAFGTAPTEREILESLIYLAEQGEAIRTSQATLLANTKPNDAKALEKQTSAAIDPQTAALASLCQALLGSNRFLYVD